MDTTKTDRLVSEAWDGDIVPQLVEYIRIPNKSPMFDADWQEHGHMDAATDLLADWARKQPIKGMKVECGAPGRPHAADLHRDRRPGRRLRAALRPPRQAAGDDRLGRRPRPVEAGAQGRQLYGRGGADDGYAIFGSLTAIRALQDRLPHARCVC
jgi:acetylornithine deacetylase/succinyl-diaminopimelate desuccinylase-like protein